MFYFLLFVLFGISGNVANESEAPRTRIEQGEIIGGTYSTYSGRKVYSFLGIPFAAPPVKERRFEPPFPPESWDKPRVFTNRSDFCVQVLLAAPVLSVGKEDCLYLDVYTPKVPKDGKCDKLFPVSFFVHPSSNFFTSGTNNEPYYLMDKHDVVFVPINYRLGIFGSLTTGDETVPGNNQLKDQLMALKWVQKNIRSFCGNPDLVTFTGASQGSLSSALHMISPQSKGLFHRVIAVSATPYLYTTFHPEGKEIGKAVANELNCPTGNSKEMVECLKLKNADLFWDLELQYRTFFLTPIEIYGGAIEVCHKGAFLSKTPDKALVDGDLAQNIPMLNVESEYEGNVLAYMMAIPGILEVLDLTYQRNLKYIFDFYHMMPPHLFENVSEAVKQEYFGNGFITGNEHGFKKMVTDGIFSQGFYEMVTKYARHTNSPLYSLRNYYRGVFSTSTFLTLIQSNKNYGASHYDTSLYAVFDGLSDKKFRLKKKDKAMVDFMTELYYSFMVYGKPSVADKLGWVPQPKTGEELYYLRLDNPYRMYMAKEENYGNRKFWQSLPIQRYYGYPDDFCELEGKKPLNANNRPNEHDENNTSESKPHGKNKRNEQNDQQAACDRNQQEKMQQLHKMDKWHNHRWIENHLHRQQQADKMHSHQNQ